MSLLPLVTRQENGRLPDRTFATGPGRVSEDLA
jgi:hypothetical protein